MKRILSLKMDLPSYSDVNQIYLFTSDSEISFDKLKEMYKKCDSDREYMLLTSHNFKQIADFINNQENKAWLFEELAKIDNINKIGKITDLFIENYHAGRNTFGRVELNLKIEIDNEKVFEKIEEEKERFIKEIRSSDPEKIEKLSLRYKESVNIEKLSYDSSDNEIFMLLNVKYVMEDFEKSHLDFYKNKKMFYKLKFNNNQTTIEVKNSTKIKV